MHNRGPIRTFPYDKMTVKLFSTKGFAENKVKIVECRVLYTLQECEWGAHLPSLGRLACRWIWQILWHSAGAKPDLRLPSQRRALPLSLDQYLFPFALTLGGWVNQVVGYIPRLYTGINCHASQTLSTNWDRLSVLLSMCLLPLPLSQTATRSFIANTNAVLH